MGKMNLLARLIRKCLVTIIPVALAVCYIESLLGSPAGAEALLTNEPAKVRNIHFQKDRRDISHQGVLTISANIAPSDEITLTPEQLKEYEETYSDPCVIRIRRFLDEYTTSPRKIEGAEKIAASSLASIKIDKALLKGKFIVYWVTGALGGGQTITIISQKSPDVMLDFWVYQIADGTCQVRDVSGSKFSNDAKDKIKKMYRPFLEDPKRAL